MIENWVHSIFITSRFTVDVLLAKLFVRMDIWRNNSNRRRIYIYHSPAKILPIIDNSTSKITKFSSIVLRNDKKYSMDLPLHSNFLNAQISKIGIKSDIPRRPFQQGPGSNKLLDIPWPLEGRHDISNIPAF